MIHPPPCLLLSVKYELNRPGEPLSSSHSAKRVANTKLHFSVRPNPYAALPDEGDRLCRSGGGEVPWCWKLKNPGDLLAAAVVPLLRYSVVADPPRGCIATEYPSRLRCKRWAENVIHSARVQIEPGRATVGCQRKSRTCTTPALRASRPARRGRTAICSVLNAEVEQLVNGAGHHFTRRHIRAYVRGAFPALQLCAARAQSFVVAGTSQFASADEREDGSDTTTLSGKILAFP